MKTSIAALSSEMAATTLAGLEPVTFEYKAAPGEGQVGFIAEDVPELVASADRKGLSAMDITAVLTRVVQDLQAQVLQQQQQLQEQQQRMEALTCAE